MGDLANALEMAGLSAIGRGETTYSLLKGIKQAVKVKFVAVKRKGQWLEKMKERILFPFKKGLLKSQYKTNDYEFLDIDNWPFLPPMNRGLKTKFGIYIDELLKFDDLPPDSEVFFDKKLNVFIRTAPDKFRIYLNDADVIANAGDGFGVDPDVETKVIDKFTKVDEKELTAAKKSLERSLRALQRDIDRNYEGKKVSFQDDNPFVYRELTKEDAEKLSKEEARRKMQIINKTGINRPIPFGRKPQTIQETLDNLRKTQGKLSFNAFELLNDAAKYQDWIHNFGSKTDLKYEIQDIQNQIKAVEALSHSKIRDIAVNVINRAIRGDDLTFSDLYHDIQRITGIGPVQVSTEALRLKAGDVRDIGEVYDDMVKEIVRYAPSTARIFADQSMFLAGKAAVGSVLKYIPKIGSFVSGAISAYGATVGLLAFGAVEVLVLLTAISLRYAKRWRIFSEETKNIEVNDLTKVLSQAQSELKKTLIEHDKELLKKIREDRRNERITSEQRDFAAAAVERDLVMKKAASKVFKEGQKKLSREMSTQLPYIEETPTQIILHYVRNGRSGRQWTSLTASKRASRAGIELDKENYKKSYMALARAARTRGSSNDTRIAFIERTLGREVPIIDTDVIPQVQNLSIVPSSSNNSISAFVSDIGSNAIKSAATSFAADRIFNFANHLANNYIPGPRKPLSPFANPPRMRRPRESHVHIEPVDDDEGAVNIVRDYNVRPGPTDANGNPQPGFDFAAFNAWYDEMNRRPAPLRLGVGNDPDPDPSDIGFIEEELGHGVFAFDESFLIF